VNIFPLSYLLNFFRDHKITPKMMFIMWFSGKLKLKVWKTGKKISYFFGAWATMGRTSFPFVE